MEVSAGTGTIRGSPIADAGDDAGWARSTTSRANDVEIYLTQDAQESGTHGLEATTIGRVAYFFEHQGNDWRRGEGGDIPPGEFTIWVAVSEYVTAGVRNTREALSLYPASSIRCVVAHDALLPLQWGVRLRSGQGGQQAARVALHPATRIDVRP